MLRAIQTKFHGPTNTKGSRVIADDGDGRRIIVSWDHALNSEGNHEAAADQLARKHGWKGRVRGAPHRPGSWLWIVEA